MAETEVIAIPVKDLRHLEAPCGGGEAVAHAVTHEAQCLLVDLRIEPLGDEGLLAQRRAADARAIDDKVHARVVEAASLAQHSVLDVVQRDLAAQQQYPLRFPRAAEHAAEVLDRREFGVLREDQLDCEGVVGVDQEGHLLRLTEGLEGGFADDRQAIAVDLQRRAVGFEASVAHLRCLPAAQRHDMLAQQRCPRRMALVEGLSAQARCGH